MNLLLLIYLVGYFVTTVYVTHIMRGDKEWSIMASLGAGAIWPILPILYYFTRNVADEREEEEG